MNNKKIALVIQAALLGSITFSTQFLSAQEKEDATQEKDVISTETTEVQAAGSKINPVEVVEQTDENKLTITGSRIKRDSFSMTTPIVTLDRDSIEDSGMGSLAEILYESVPALTTESSSTRSQSSVSTTGLSTIALRKLGTDRTLTLIDGRRTVSNSYSGNYISLSTIPSGMVKKVEIITGGASAIYGSDAIAGVVNIITQTDREGFKARTRYGETTDGGGEEYSLDLSYGTTFDNDRGYMYAAVTKDREFGIKGTQRKNSSTYDSYLYDDDEMCNSMMTADGRQCMRDITQDDWSNLSDGMLGGVFLESSRNDEQFWYDETGTLRNDWRGNEERYGYKYNQFSMIKVPEQALVAAVKVDYDFTTNTQGYFQFQHSKNESVNTKSPEDEYEGADVIIIDPVTGLPDEVRPGYIPIDNPFVPQAILDSNDGDIYRDRIYWDRRFGEVGNVITDNTRTTMRTWGGLRGRAFDDEWDWDVSVGYGKFQQKQIRHNELNTVKTALALDAEYADDGVTIQCADAAARADGCVPLNLFGPGSITPEMANYIRATPTITTDIKQVNMLAYMTGDLFEMPAGMVSVAFGTEYRKDKQDVATDAGHQYGGITFNLVPTFSGELDVTEFFAEANVPLLEDVSLAKSLSLDLSVRTAKYSIPAVDQVTSYKAGFMWELADGYSIRGNYAKSQRAPTITELLSPPRGDFDSFSDLCQDVTATSTGIGHDNCRLEPTIAAVIADEGIYEGADNGYSPNAGNPNLKEESADTITLGFSLAPEFLDGFRLSVDYYDISVEDAINAISNDNIMRGCYVSPTGTPWGPENEFCRDIRRNSDGEIIEIMQRQYNLDEEAARGFDLAADYRYDIGDWGYLNFKLDYGHVIEHSETYTDYNPETQTSVKVKTDQEGTIAYGVWEDKASISTAWYNDDWRLRWKIYWKGPVIRNHENLEDWNEYMDRNDEACADGDSDCIENPEPLLFQNYPSYVKHNFSISYNQDLGKDGELRYFFGVNNVFNNKGGFYPFATSNYVSRFGNGVGRFIYLGAEYKY